MLLSPKLQCDCHYRLIVNISVYTPNPHPMCSSQCFILNQSLVDWGLLTSWINQSVLCTPLNTFWNAKDPSSIEDCLYCIGNPNQGHDLHQQLSITALASQLRLHSYCTSGWPGSHTHGREGTEQVREAGASCGASFRGISHWEERKIERERRDQPAITAGRLTAICSSTTHLTTSISWPATTSGRHPRAAGCWWPAGQPPQIPASRSSGNVVLDLCQPAVESLAWGWYTSACWPKRADVQYAGTHQRGVAAGMLASPIPVTPMCWQQVAPHAGACAVEDLWPRVAVKVRPPVSGIAWCWWLVEGRSEAMFEEEEAEVQQASRCLC